MTIEYNLVLTHAKECGFDSQKEVKIMNKYETVFIINPNVEDTGVKALISL